MWAWDQQLVMHSHVLLHCLETEYSLLSKDTLTITAGPEMEPPIFRLAHDRFWAIATLSSIYF